MGKKTVEEKYQHALLVLRAIANRTGENKFGFDEWTQAEAFYDCRKAAAKCLKYLDEPTQSPCGCKALHNHCDKKGE